MKLPSDRWLNVNDCQIRYWHLGSQKAPPLILAHGILSNCEYWHRVIWPLSEHYQVIVFDWPGFGKSDKPAINYTLDFYLDFLKSFLDQLHIKQIMLIGHSLGGGLSLGFAGYFPHYVRKLILLDNVGFCRQVAWPFRLMSLPLLGKLMTRANQTLFEKALKTNVYDPRCLTRPFLDNAYQLGIENEARRTMLNILATHVGLSGMKRGSLQKIQQPLYPRSPTIIWGQQDPILNYTIHRSYADYYFPKADWITLDQCGHLPQLEHPQAVVEAIKYTIDRQ